MTTVDRDWIDHSIDVATRGELVITGRLVDASNATLFGTVRHNEDQFEVIYKPVAGERPLWDFPDGTLADREFAAFLLSDLAGFDLLRSIRIDLQNTDFNNSICCYIRSCGFKIEEND
jgi:hypothetical protein